MDSSLLEFQNYNAFHQYLSLPAIAAIYALKFAIFAFEIILRVHIIDT